MLVIVPYLLVPAGLAATAFAVVAAVLTHRFRRASRS
jgi:VIT1/CCC1 family predicted Fe2+/Mn2+ transporter